MTENSGRDHDHGESLEADVRALRHEIEALRRDRRETETFRVFFEARRKFLNWIAAGVVVITVFGVVSVNSVIESIRQEIERRGTDGIVRGVADKLETEYRTDLETELADLKTDLRAGLETKLEESRTRIESEIKASLEPRLLAEIQGGVREELLARVAPAAADIGQRELASRIEDSYLTERYLVVVGSSPNRPDLEREIERLRRQIDGFETAFPDVRIYPPKPGRRTPYHGIVAGRCLDLNDAQALLDRAVRAGFRSDSFITTESRTSLDVDPCPGTPGVG